MGSGLTRGKPSGTDSGASLPSVVPAGHEPAGPGPAGDGAGDEPAGTVLAREFFARSAVEVAPELLGCVLSHRGAGGVVAVVLTEVEAYTGASDPASHAFGGRTARNEVMFGPAGHAYVYFTYGMYFCVNLVCGAEGEATAVLLRAGQVIEGEPLAVTRRSQRRPARLEGGGAAGTRPRPIRPADLARGPARLCQAMSIDKSQNGADVCAQAAPLRVLAPQRAAARPPVSSGPRVGITKAAEVPWRFWLSGDPTVSAYRPGVIRRRAKPGSVPRAGDGTMHR